MASKFLTWGSNQIPRLMLGLFWGSVDPGLIQFGFSPGRYLMEVAVVPRYAVARVELRRFVDDPGALRSALGRALTFLTVFCFPLCVGAAAVVPTLFHVWLDPRWVGAIIPAQCMLLTCVAAVTQYMAGATLLAMNFQRAEAVVSVAQNHRYAGGRRGPALRTASCRPRSPSRLARSCFLPLSVWLLRRAAAFRWLP